MKSPDELPEKLNQFEDTDPTIALFKEVAGIIKLYKAVQAQAPEPALVSNWTASRTTKISWEAGLDGAQSGEAGPGKVAGRHRSGAASAPAHTL